MISCRKNDHIKEKKFHSWRERKIGGRSATVLRHTRLLLYSNKIDICFIKRMRLKSMLLPRGRQLLKIIISDILFLSTSWLESNIFLPRCEAILSSRHCNHTINSISLKLSIPVGITSNSFMKIVLKKNWSSAKRKKQKQFENKKDKQIG